MHLRALFRRRPTASMVISLIALFVALGGASYAAVSLPNNSVGTAQIKNNAVNYKKIATHTIGLQRIDATKVQVRVSGTCTERLGDQHDRPGRQGDVPVDAAHGVRRLV